MSSRTECMIAVVGEIRMALGLQFRNAPHKSNQQFRGSWAKEKCVDNVQKWAVWIEGMDRSRS